MQDSTTACRMAGDWSTKVREYEEGGEAGVTTPSEERPPLPSFTTPPVQLVSFALMFEPVPLKSVHMGLLWTERLREKYADVVDSPPVVNQTEQFSIDPLMPQFQFQIMQGPPAPQVVFRSPTTGLRLGVQPDRLTHIWERADEAPYPRYQAVRDSFEQDATGFGTFCEDQLLGNVGVNQVEVQYVNVLTSGEGWERPGELHRVLQPWNPEFSSDLGEPEDVRIAQRYIAVRGDEPYGRLHVEVAPLVASTGETHMQMALTFRGWPREYSLEGIMAFLDDGHDRIVRAFAAATTPEMHQVWGREQ